MPEQASAKKSNSDIPHRIPANLLLTGVVVHPGRFMPERQQGPAQRLLRGRRFSSRSSKPGQESGVCAACRRFASVCWNGLPCMRAGLRQCLAQSKVCWEERVLTRWEEASIQERLFSNGFAASGSATATMHGRQQLLGVGRVWVHGPRQGDVLTIPCVCLSVLFFPTARRCETADFSQ